MDDNERNVVRYAYHAFARGDPGGFSIQFAVLLQAHARALKSVPERLRKVVAMELATMSDSLAVHRLSIKEADSVIVKDAEEIRQGVVSLTEEIREFHTLINQMRETEIPAREKFLSEISEELSRRNLRFGVANLHAQPRELRARSGFLASIGPENVIRPYRDAALAYRKAQ